MHYSVLIAPQGPLVAVHVGVSAQRHAALTQAGQPVPAPILANLLLDTGASCTSIDASVIAQLGLQPTGTQGILTPSTGATPHQCSTYDVSLMIPGATPQKIIPAIAIIDGNYLSQGHHGLIGRDALRDARVVYSGPDGYVMLSF
ncbi:MAG TPA: aspartyl protease family protein [Rhizomicrobium sp.]